MHSGTDCPFLIHGLPNVLCPALVPDQCVFCLCLVFSAFRPVFVQPSICITSTVGTSDAMPKAPDAFEVCLLNPLYTGITNTLAILALPPAVLGVLQPPHFVAVSLIR